MSELARAPLPLLAIALHYRCMFNTENPSVLGFMLSESHGTQCDGCGGFVRRHGALLVHPAGQVACSEECAGELGARDDDAAPRLFVDRFGPGGQRPDLASPFAAVGMR